MVIILELEEMSKERKIIIVLVALLTILLSLWIFDVPSPWQPRKDWRLVRKWSASSESYYEGDYNLTTNLFKIEGEEWRIVWGCSVVHGASCFYIIVYDGYTDEVVKEILTHPLENTFYGESYFKNKGRFYLKIYIYGTLENWFISVLEYR